jgi:hypothetical protein
MTFYVGQKVVCVDAACTTVLGLQELIEGSTYTIRWVGHAPHKQLRNGRFSTTVCVRLVEILRDTCPTTGIVDLPFNIQRFRPVVERKTSIEIFKRMLNPSDRKINEEV